MRKLRLEPELLEDAPLRYAPTNEMGVIFLFSHLCRRMQVHVVSVQSGFPDCIARQRVGGQEREIRIEFEFRSSSYRAHGHSLSGCDWIVCWEHDWAEVPANIQVVELRRYYGRGFNVWAVSMRPWDYAPIRFKYVFGKAVAKGDIVLIYEWWPKTHFSHIYRVADTGAVKTYVRDTNGRKGLSYVHTLRRVCTLDPPLHMKALEADRLIPGDKIMSGSYNRKITEHWWRIHELLLRRNPDCAAALKPFSPSNV